MVSERQIKGRTIVGFDAGAWQDPEYGVRHTPTIHLDDGTVLIFTAEETSGADYGVFIGKTVNRHRRKP